MFHMIGKAAARVGRRAALGTLASVLVTVGIGFFTAALWLYLVTVFGPMQAALMIGLGYSGAGLVCFGIVMSSGEPDPMPEPQEIAQARQSVTAPPLVEAFLYGLHAGSHASKTRSC